VSEEGLQRALDEAAEEWNFQAGIDRETIELTGPMSAIAREAYFDQRLISCLQTILVCARKI
jgi:hypothetical protein